MKSDELKGKRLLLLGSSVWRNIIRRFADEYGVHLIVAGKDATPLDNIADEVYRIDSIDHTAMKAFIKTHDIDGVYMGGSELIISHACQYINELGLPCYCTPEQWETLQDKAKFKALCIKHGLPVVPSFAIDPKNVKASVPAEVYPVITKPTDGCGSSGFTVCRTAEELVRGYRVASENSRSGSVICEKFVKNEGIVVFFSFTNGEMVFTLAEDKYPVRYEKQGSYVAGLFLCESRLTEDFRSRYEKRLAAVFQELGIKEGCVWIEVFYDNGQYYFNEVGFRYGGSFSFYTVDYFRRINQVYADLYYALTGQSRLTDFSTLLPLKIQRGLKYCIYPVHLMPGTIGCISGLDEILAWPNVVAVPKQKEAGNEILDTGSFGQVALLVHFVYNDDREWRAAIDRIHATLRVTSVDGKEMVNRMLDCDSVGHSC